MRTTAAKPVTTPIPVAVCREERAHSSHHWPADPTGTELRRGKYDDLRLALRNRIGNADLMGPRVRGIARIDLVQVWHVAGNQFMTPRSGGAWLGGTGGREDVDGEARHRHRPVSLLGKHLKAPGAGPLNGHRRDVEAPPVGRLVVHVLCPIWMDMHTHTLFDNLQPDIGYLHLCLQLGLLAVECVDPHHDIGLLEEPLTVAPSAAAPPLRHRGYELGRATIAQPPGTARGGTHRHSHLVPESHSRRHQPDGGSRRRGHPAATSCAYLCPDGRAPVASGVPPG